jgi:hypothetical protein
MVNPNQPTPEPHTTDTEPYTGAERLSGPACRVPHCEHRTYGYRFPYCHRHDQQRREARQNREWWAQA